MSTNIWFCMTWHVSFPRFLVQKTNRTPKGVTRGGHSVPPFDVFEHLPSRNFTCIHLVNYFTPLYLNI